MALEITMAESAGDLARVQRHRYDVYCEEMRRFRETADHDRDILIEPVDEVSRHCCAWLDGELIGSMRWTWGGDAPFGDPHVETFRLGQFLETVAPNQIVIAERFIVSQDHRDRDVVSAMLGHFMGFVNHHRIQLVISECEPHLLNHHAGLGYRPYSVENIDSTAAGYLIPLVLVAEDIGYLRDIGSPLAEVLRDFGGDARVPEVARTIAADSGAVRLGRLTSDEEYWRDLQTAFALASTSGLHLFDGLGEDEVRAVTQASAVIECRAGDRVLRKREVARNMYVVLSGSLEARDGDRYLATLMRGDVIGEIAFILSTPRTADVVAMHDGTQLLSLSEATLMNLVDTEPALAARLMLNLAKLLCAKLAFRAM